MGVHDVSKIMEIIRRVEAEILPEKRGPSHVEFGKMAVRPRYHAWYHNEVIDGKGGMTDKAWAEAESQRLLMRGGLGLTKPPKEEEWRMAEEIHLMDNELFELPERPLCAVLSALYLQRNYKLRKIPPSFFECMNALQVLNLSNTGIRSLPASLFELIGLKQLFLNGCHNFMKLSPRIGELGHLEVLDLKGTEIIDLPLEVKRLTYLKFLEVSFYNGCINQGRENDPSNAMISVGIISALSRLEELNIDVNPDDERWVICLRAIVNEVHHLEQLNALKLYIPSVALLSIILDGPLIEHPRLIHFRFIVGRHSKRIISRLPCDAEFELERMDRCLKYINGQGVHKYILKVLRLVTAFHLDRHITVKKLSEFGIENMERLKCCVLGECDAIQVIIDGEDVPKEVWDTETVSQSYDGEEDSDTETIIQSYIRKEKGTLQSLEYLNIYYMKSLRSIWGGPVHTRCFSLLKSLNLRTCPQLTTIFTLPLLDNLYSLEELKVDDCPAIKSLVSCENSTKQEVSSSNSEFYLPKLKKISLYYVPELVSISSGVRIAPLLEWLSFYNCPNLKSLSMEEVCSTDLKRITGERDWWEALKWTNGRPDNLDGIFVPIKAGIFI